MDVKEQTLTRILEELVRTEERVAQAKAPLVEELGFDRIRAYKLEVGQVVYTGQTHEWQEVATTRLCAADECEPVTEVTFDGGIHHFFADEFVDVKVEPAGVPF